MGWLRRLRNTVLRSSAAADLDEELRFHFERRVEDYVQQGLPRDDALRAATRRLGNLPLTSERTRAADTIHWLADFGQDLVYGLRTLRKHPAFAGIAILTLALGVGLNVAIFIFYDALVFRPPDVPRSGELVRLFSSTPEATHGKVSYPDYLDFAGRTTSLAGVVAFDDTLTVAVARQPGDARQVVGAAMVSGNLFSVLGIELALGRGFHDRDDQPGAGGVVVISHKLWERLFHSDPGVIGEMLSVARGRFTVVGVTGVQASHVMAIEPDVFIPIAMVNDVVSATDNRRADRSAAWLTVVGRLASGAAASAAALETAALAQSLAREYPDTNRHRSAVVLPEMAARAALSPARQQAAVLLLAVTGLVLLIACANVVNLLLSHGAGRTKEIAVRRALGASAGRVARQLLTETAVLACGGGVLGLGLAYVGVQYLSAIVQSVLSAYDIQPLFDVRIDGRVIAFTVVASMVTMVSGLVPALRSSRVDFVSGLKGTTVASRRRRFTIRGFLVASQTTVSVFVLAMAGLSIRQFIDVRRTDPGFDVDDVLLVNFDPSTVGYTDRQADEFYRQMAERTRALPGVQAVGFTQDVPLIYGFRFTPVAVDGFETPQGQESLSIRSFVVDPGYWSAMMTPIVRGRAFTEQDASTGPRVIVVNETMARRYWPKGEAVGGTVRLGGPGGLTAEVIGVASDGKYGNIAESPQAVIYIPLSQKNNRSLAMTMVVRVIGDPTSFAEPIRTEARALDANLPAFNIRSLRNVFDVVALGQQSLVAQMMVFVGLLAIVLTVVGLYGVIAHLTALRVREIGIRMALGATRRAVLEMVLAQAAGMVGAGLAAGAGLAFGLMPAFAFAFNFTPRAPMMIATVALAVAGTAFVASWLPARRAAALNPIVALRED
jgi:predicted permease